MTAAMLDVCRGQPVGYFEAFAGLTNRYLYPPIALALPIGTRPPIEAEYVGSQGNFLLYMSKT
jgi:hypothetical protein